jgi:hypothetical protein
MAIGTNTRKSPLYNRGCLGALALLCVLLPSLTAHASPLSLSSTREPIKIDGILDDAAWRQATHISLDIETDPGENIPAPVETLVYVVENGESLYVAFDARDPDPSAIRAFLRDRDSAWHDDIVGIALDTYNDERRAFQFFVNPLGVQMDITNDDVAKREDSSWDAIWDSAGQINDNGFVVEMEIPLNQLRFPNIEGKQTWGIDLLRFYPRDRRHRISNNVRDRSINCFLCQFSKITGLDGVTPGRDLEIVPTLTGLRTESTDEPGVIPLQGGGTDAEAGVSIRWGITPGMTANLAINPDFSQVEADVAQLDVNNQFALFFEEKRPFFLEGGDYFSTPINAVFTRTVADPDVGAKLTGKRDEHTYGVFVAQDAATNLLFPGAFSSDTTSLEQDNSVFVGRYSYGFGDASSVGALLTSRDGDDYSNVVGGLDFRWRINDQHALRAQILRSETEYPDSVAEEFEQPIGRFDGDGVGAAYNYDSRNWFAAAFLEEYSPGFRADTGFVSQVDIRKQGIGAGHVWHGTDETWWNRLRLGAEWIITHDDAGRLLEREIETYFVIQGPLQSFIRIRAELGDELWEDVLYEEKTIGMYAQMRPVGGLETGLWMSAGDSIDYDNSRPAKMQSIEPFVDWNISRHLSLKLRTDFFQLETEEGNAIIDADVYDLRLTWQFNRRSYLRFTTQRFDISRNQDEYIDDVDARTRDVGRQLLYSYKINPQTVFFLGYSDNLTDDDTLSGLEETDRTAFMKIGYAFTP